MLGGAQALMVAAVAAAAAVAAVCWLGALLCFVMMLRNTSGRRSVGHMLLHGTAVFAAENFNELGQRFQRLFVRCFAGFFAGIAVVAVVAALATNR